MMWGRGGDTWLSMIEVDLWGDRCFCIIQGFKERCWDDGVETAWKKSECEAFC